jgi:hypothetical protein
VLAPKILEIPASIRTQVLAAEILEIPTIVPPALKPYHVLDPQAVESPTPVLNSLQAYVSAPQAVQGWAAVLHSP